LKLLLKIIFNQQLVAHQKVSPRPGALAQPCYATG